MATDSRGLLRGNTRGFSIIEALISFVVVTLAVVALFGTLPFAFGRIQSNADTVQAYAAGQQFMDVVRNAVYDGSTAPTSTTAPIYAGRSYVNGSTLTATGTFTISRDSCPGFGASQPFLRHCTITVAWTEQGAAKSVTIDSYAVRQK